VEYKLWVDSNWILDPLNKRKTQGGYGENSDVWMPEYVPPSTIEYNPNIPHGTIDTFWIESKFLHHTHPIFVYTPAGNTDNHELPVLFVTDGGDYLSLGKMNNILDHLLAAKHIRPLIVVFTDPRTNLNDNTTNKRMNDYAANDTFLDFLEKEIAPFVEEKYHTTKNASQRTILGASMGGLIATYAVLKRPQFVLNCAAQSPAYLQAHAAVIELTKNISKISVNIYIDTGTIHDTQEEASLVAGLLKDKDANVSYAEYPEGHNWSNWRARIGKILEYFFPAK
jgi:enterochelin esterase-like enzyme